MPKKLVYLVLLGIGVFILVQVIMPLVWFKIWESTSYAQNISLASPSPDSQTLGVSIKNIDSFPAFVSSNTRIIKPNYSEFLLSVPSIKLDKAFVTVDSNEFDTSLAQLPGTALPGEKGNLFITGHSSLPQFYKIGNYKAILAHLPDVKKGDEIIVEAGGQKYTYIVQGLKVVDPKEVWVINPPDQNGRYLSLMTCVPPGFYFKRLVVLAKLIE